MIPNVYSKSTLRLEEGDGVMKEYAPFDPIEGTFPLSIVSAGGATIDISKAQKLMLSQIKT